jgi:hypothetical protein
MTRRSTGIGRYPASRLGADPLLDANGELPAQYGAGGFVAWHHAFNGSCAAA